MAELRKRLRRRRLNLITLAAVGLTGTACLVFAVLWQIDFGDSGAGILEVWSSPKAIGLFDGLAEVTVAVLGVALTVVAVLVQLAAFRYTPRITDLFGRDPVSMVAVSWFVITATLVLWVTMSVHGEHHPRVMVITTILAVSVAILGLLPYFAYLFYFLSPRHIVRRIRLDVERAMSKVAKRGEGQIRRSRGLVLTSIEHLDDMAQDAVKKDDKGIAIMGLEALADVLRFNVDLRDRLPEAWFVTAGLAESDKDFVALHPTMMRNLQERRLWVDMKILRGLEFTFRRALGRMQDITHLIALHTRRYVESAVERGDEHAARLGVRYFNTFLRHSVNARDVRSAYNVLNEYRLLAMELMRRGRDVEVIEAAHRLKYYGHQAFQQRLDFVMETVAMDMAELLEAAHSTRSPIHDAVLEVFLELDREPFGDLEAQERSLRGVRKAQARLATYYLNVGATAYARLVFEDMRDESPERLRSIWRELAELTDPEWWEVANRDTNWDYLPDDRRAKLEEFFSWFNALG